MTKIKNFLDFDERKYLDNNVDYMINKAESFSNMYTNLHEHDFAEIFFLVSGSVTYVIEQGQYDLKDYDIIVVPPHTLHQIKVNNKDAKFKRVVLWIYPQFIKHLSTKKTDLTEQLFKFSYKNNYLIHDPEFYFKIKPLLEQIISLQDSAEYASDVYAENLFRLLLIQFNKYLENRTDFPQPIGNPVILKLVNYIDEHLAEDLPLKQLAEYMEMDQFYLSHIFSKEVGVTIHKYIIKKRLNLAKKMLDDGIPIRTIVPRIGFNDISHFIQAFKIEYKITPLQYQKKARK